MVTKYWNFYIQGKSGQKYVWHTIKIPTLIKNAHNKRISFLNFSALNNHNNDIYVLICDQLVSEDNLYSVTVDKDNTKKPSIGYSIITCSGTYPHPKTFTLKDELDEIKFFITSANDLKGISFVIETQIEYDI